MGKLFLLGIAIAFGYFIGYRDARAHSDHIVTRSIEEVRVFFGADGSRNDVDAVMNKLEGGKN
jgi:hypothetical protein